MKRAVLLIALAACGGKKTPATPPPPPAAPDAGPAQPEIPEALRAKAADAVALVEELATAAEGVKVQSEAECPAQATALRTVGDGVHGKAILVLEADPEYPKFSGAIDSVLGAQLEKASDRLGDAIMMCSYDPDVVQVLLDTGLLQSPAESDEPVE